MRIVVIDDHPVVRNGLMQTFGLEEDIEVVGTAASCKEGMELIASEKPDLAILDLRMPDGSGLDIVRHGKNLAPDCRFLILTAYGSPQEVSQAVSEQVGGYILKDALPEEIVNAARLVGKGRRYFDPQTMEIIVKRDEENPLNSLTLRETEILDALSVGMNNGTIAETLHISEKTVKKHVSNLMAKLGVQNRIQAVLLGFAQSHEQQPEKQSSRGGILGV
jgi:two-component system nitrate/nitrite response regulator NarL